MRTPVTIEPAVIYENPIQRGAVYKKPVVKPVQQPEPVIIEPAKVYIQPKPVQQPEPVIIEPAKVYIQPKPVQQPEPVIIEPAKVYIQPKPVQQPEPVIIDSNKTEDMTAFKKTVFGKILGGAAKVFIPIAAAVTGIGAISGAAKGIGAIAGVKNIFGGAAKGIDSVATKAADMVTGLSQEQRKELRAEKDEAKEAKNKLDFAERLLKAGSSKTEAYVKAGIDTDEIDAGIKIADNSTSKYLMFGGAILGVIALLAFLGKKR